MKRKILASAAFAAILAALAAAPILAEEKAAAPSKSEAQVRKLLELSGTSQMGKQMVDQMISAMQGQLPGVPADFWTEFKKEANVEEFTDKIVPLYQKHFTDKDVAELIAFYESPIGKKLVDRQPKLMAESMALGQEWGKSVAQRAVDSLTKKGLLPGAPQQ